MQNTKKLAVIALIAASAFALTGCGAIAQKMTSNEDLLDKAEFATGIEAKNLTVIPNSVHGELDAVHFKVKTNKGATYRCYFTSAIAVTSDAVCTKIGAKEEVKSTKNVNAKNAGKKSGKSQSSDCNALLRAAGRC